MATFCFLTDQKALLAEAGVRGWHAAILDYPQQKSEEEMKKAALLLPDELRSEVCHIPENDHVYGVLVVSTWAAFYMAMPQVVGERLMAHLIVKVKPMAASDARAFLHRIFSEDARAREVLDDLYTRYQTGLALMNR